MVFTKNDYFKALNFFCDIGMRLEDSGAEYFYETKEERKIHNEHDKLVKKILERPREVEFVVRKALGIKEKLEIEEVRNEFITIDYRGKQVDLLYKIKGKEVYLLIEHQSTQDVKMPYRILEYEVQIMDRSFRKNNYQAEKLAKVIAIVIYTGPGKWKMPQRLEEIQITFGYSKKILEDYDLTVGYNLLDINKLSKEELLEEETLFGRMMLVERARREEDLIEILEEILPLTKDEEREDVINILRYILVKDIGEEKAQEYIKKLEEGVIDMSGYVNYLRQDREATMLKMRDEGKSEGIKEGKREGVKEGKKFGENNIIKILFKNKMSAKEIAEKTGIALSEILKIVKT